MNNVRIFEVIRSEYPVEEKKRKLIEYLDQGVDINVTDTHNNTLLHVAALSEEPAIFKLLLERGVNYNIKNNDNQNIIDIMYNLKSPKGEKIFTAFYNRYGNQKRPGTLGIKGELYEIQLMSLILVRALYKTEYFLLGTNITAMGAFDDIVFRYKTNKMVKPKILFLQTKHKPKEYWDVDCILESIKLYYKSYLNVKQHFLTSYTNIMFEGWYGNFDYEMIIYTCAKAKVTRNKKNKFLQQVLADSFIRTSTDGMSFKVQFENNDDNFKNLVKYSAALRITELANTLSTLILSDNCKQNIMKAYLINLYHVFLAQHVITAVDEPGSKKSRFRPSFLTSEQKELILLRDEISKNVTEAGKDIISLTFELPDKFGNRCFQFTRKKNDHNNIEKDLSSVCSLFQILFRNGLHEDANMIVRLDDDSVIEGIIIKKELRWLKGLVGNLLIYDSETEMLKFNMNYDGLTSDSKIILQTLTSKSTSYDLSTFRFDINVYGFPIVSLNNTKLDEKLVTQYLNRLKINTNQSYEDNIKNIFINEIVTLSKERKKKQPDYRKCENIYLKIREKIKDWSLLSHFPYLTKFHNYYEEAEQETPESFSQLKIIHNKCIEKIRKTSLTFETEAVRALGLNRFLGNDKGKRLMILSSDDILFSTIKVHQYFTETPQEHDYIFLNLDSANIHQYLDILNNELDHCETNIYAIVSIENHDVASFDQVMNVTNKKRNKTIIIAQNVLRKAIHSRLEVIQHIDDKSNFSSLSKNSRQMIIEERHIIFQGREVPVNTVLDNESLNLLSSSLLRQLINNDKIVIGNASTDNCSDTLVNYYEDQSLYQCIHLKICDQTADVCLITDGSKIDQIPQETKEIVLITESEDVFVDTCKSNSKSNIHWFIDNSKDQNYKHIAWKRSHGSLQTILKYVDRSDYGCEDKNPTLSPKTLKDIEEKIVIVSAKSGMGKSTLLTNLVKETNLKHPNHWIIKINLNDDSVVAQLNEWHKHNTNVDLIKTVTFLYSQIGPNKNDNIHKRVSKHLRINSNDELFLIDNDDALLDDDLSIIKLFNYFYNKNNLAILVDNFDKICSKQADEVIKLLRTLKISKVAHLWVTSRPYSIIEQLESALGCLSYNLSPITSSGRVKVLKNIWNQKLEPEVEYSIYRIEVFCDVIRKNLYFDDHFMGVPLNLHIIADLYQSDLKHFIDNNGDNMYKLNSNIISFYEKFFDKKFDIQFDKQFDMIKKADKHKQFFEDHKRIFALLLHKNLFNNDIQNVKELIKRIERTGIIESRPHGELNFVNISCATYFAAEFIFDKLRAGNCDVWKYFVNNLLTDKQYQVIVNIKLHDDQSIITKLKSSTELRHAMYDIMLAQFNNSNTTAIYIAIKDNYKYITIFLIECLKFVLNKSNVPAFLKLINKNCGIYCVFCFAVGQRTYNIKKYLQDLITDITCQDSYKINHLQPSSLAEQACVSLSSFSQDQGTIGLIAELLYGYGLRSHKDTIYRVLGKNGFIIQFCFDNILKFNDEQRSSFFKDLNEEPPISYIKKENEAAFYPAVATLLDKAELKKKMVNGDYSSFKYIYLMLKNVLKNIDFESNLAADVGIENFVLNKIPKLYPDTSPSTDIYNPLFWCGPSYFEYVLYLDKLFHLFLLRLLCNDDIKEFIVKKLDNSFVLCAYKTKDKEKVKAIFLNIVYPDIKIDFNLETKIAFRTYYETKTIFATDNKDSILRGSMKNIASEFVIYTNAEYRSEKIVGTSNTENAIIGNKYGKILKYKDVEIEDNLVKSLIDLRVSELVTLLRYAIESPNFVNYDRATTKYLIQQYYFLLMGKLIELKRISRTHCRSTFRQDFLASNDPNLLSIRRSIYNYFTGRYDTKEIEANELIEIFYFDLPLQFTERYFGIYEDEMELNSHYLCSIFEKIFQNLESKDSVYVLDNDSVGPDEIVQRADLVGNISLARLVGTLLIQDNETDLLKFNLEESSLTRCDIEIMRFLKDRYDLTRFRFDIKIYGFPLFSLYSENHDRKFVQDFLSRLSLYTEQVNINELDKMFKNEIHTYLNIEKRHHDVSCRVKCDKIFLNNLNARIKNYVFDQYCFSTDLNFYEVPISNE